MGCFAWACNKPETAALRAEGFGASEKLELSSQTLLTAPR